MGLANAGRLRIGGLFSQDRLTAGSHRHHCSDRRDDAPVAEQHVSE
ncbi:hypothetical protein [Limosilactobacillus mucosae]|nr:hypothetical protein [Limosilactobacillus mucosae]